MNHVDGANLLAMRSLAVQAKDSAITTSGNMETLLQHYIALQAENLRLREALETRRDWFAMQIKSASKGNFSEWDLHALQIELDAVNAALTVTKGH